MLIFLGKFLKIKPTPEIILTGRALGVEKESVGLDERKSHEKSAVDCILKRWGKVFPLVYEHHIQVTYTSVCLDKEIKNMK